MGKAAKKQDFNLSSFFQDFSLKQQTALFDDQPQKTLVDFIDIEGDQYPRFINEYWTAKQRQASSLHEIAYRACFKGQLPKFFIELFTNPEEIVYDPFSGRGTTIIEAGLLGRNVISNDINPLSKILARPRLNPPTLKEIESRLTDIPINKTLRAEIDLSMFFNPATEGEIVSLRKYLISKSEANREDHIDEWIRMVATNRLTGHSSGFFSVYTLPPNQAVSPESQIKINAKRNQKPEYRDTRKLIFKKSKSLLRNLSDEKRTRLINVGRKAKFFCNDARFTKNIKPASVAATVTSPPFLDVVQYADDNWMRCWFNNLSVKEIEKQITMAKNIDEWESIMGDVFKELYRITKNKGWVAFEVGEVRGGKIRLDEHVIPLGIQAGFKCEGIVINQQIFTKTSNIWGISNNTKGTNTNRIVLFEKGE